MGEIGTEDGASSPSSFIHATETRLHYRQPVAYGTQREVAFSYFNVLNHTNQDIGLIPRSVVMVVP
jgi:hypothetical protein